MRALLLLVLLISACTSSLPVSDLDCPRENMICPDGSIVMRELPDCEFHCQEIADPCGFYDTNKIFYSKTPAECGRMKFDCSPIEKKFSDECGCGCEFIPELKGAHICEGVERSYGSDYYCPPEKSIVCGWMDEGTAQTFDNRCEACKEQNIAYVTEGACPK